MSNAFDNTVLIITGAASGMGREMAIQAAQKPNCRVIGCDINQHELEKTKVLAGGNIEVFHLDVADFDAIKHFSKSVIPTLNGKKLVLINNAGVALAAGTFHDTPMEDFDWLININLYGVVRMTKVFLPYMLEHNQGHIITISSIFGLAGAEFNSAYCTSKFANRGFTEVLRMELIDTKIRTTVVHPGGVRTNVTNNSRAAGTAITNEIHLQVKEQFNKTAMTSASKAAKKILHCVETGRRRLLIGIDGSITDLMVRLFPVKYTRMMMRGLRHTFGNPYDDKKNKKT